MTFQLKPILVFVILFCSCSTGNLKIVASIDSDLDEASAVETIKKSDLIWTIEDAGNKNTIYGLDKTGNIIKKSVLKGIKNIDWEDLTSDELGNIYIGDFGNNNKKRKQFFIYKIENIAKAGKTLEAKTITFSLPDIMKSKDFEAFFLWNNFFYLFTKESNKTSVFKIPNTIGNHVAKLVTDYTFNAAHTKITSVDISPNGKVIVLLNHDKLWQLSGFKNERFFSANVDLLSFKHKSQKEGICFKNDSLLYITDERNAKTSNIYSFKLKPKP